MNVRGEKFGSGHKGKQIMEKKSAEKVLRSARQSEHEGDRVLPVRKHFDPRAKIQI